jgi:hypothetical protein
MRSRHRLGEDKDMDGQRRGKGKVVERTKMGRGQKCGEEKDGERTEMESRAQNNDFEVKSWLQGRMKKRTLRIV